MGTLSPKKTPPQPLPCLGEELSGSLLFPPYQGGQWGVRFSQQTIAPLFKGGWGDRPRKSTTPNLARKANQRDL